ncbi:leucine-rich repeat protein [uncultured Algibacter sp.]|uniref:leucine-rich repeat protein n=1 Tax=uncultured Algibacter sp. TaxID=298659 RepID=UPI002633E553|nr:leucine-rich repeat protein [uncultured Algibacter sp.]
MKKSINLLIIFFTFVLISCDKDNDVIIEEKEVIKVPEIETYQVSEITVFSVKMGGKILNQGDSDILEVGLVIGESSKPSIENNFAKFILNANGSDEFITTVTSLPEEISTFYVKAYALNSQGIGYGNEVQFQTLGNKTYEGSIKLSNQDDVNEFGKNDYNTIKGSLTIEGSVVDLSPLKELIIIGNYFNVERTSLLKNFKGLENLRKVGHLFANGSRIEYNQSLENFEGLDKLDIINGNFYILNNDKLTSFYGLKSFGGANWGGALRIENCNNLINLEGLEKLKFLGGELAIVNNPLLESISYLENLELVNGYIYFGENQSLKNLDGLEKIKNIDFLFLNFNPSLTNIDAIKNCESLSSIKIDGNSSLINFPIFTNVKSISSIEIRYGSEIKNLSGLENLDNIESLKFFKSNIESLEGVSDINKIGTLEFYECQKLNNLIGIENVQEIDNLSIRYCNSFNSLEGFKLNTIGNFALAETNITSLKGLESLRYVKDAFTLHFNEELENTNGLKNIEEIKDLWIDGNSKLNSINAFENLKNLNYLFILNNKSLSNLIGFNNLESINELGIMDSSLENLSGLNNLKQINNRFQATYNPNLNDYCSLSEAFENFTGNYEVYSNLYNPTKEDLKNGNCN